MSTIEKIMQKVDVAEDLAKKIWLAGLGAYGKSYDEVQTRYEKLNGDASKVFDDLVAKGEAIESETKDKIVEKTPIDKRVADVRKKLGLDSGDTEQRLDELNAKVDALTAAIEKMTKQA